MEMFLNLLTTLSQLHEIYDVEWRIANGESGRIWKEVFTSYLRYNPNICLDGGREGGREDNHEKSQPEYAAFGLRIKLEASRI
jgi:hypothetical protein